MDFTLPESAQAVRRGIADICSRYDMDYWQRCEAEKRWPEEVWAELAKGGWLGLAVPEEYGGAGQGLLELAVATETLSASGSAGGSAFMYVLTPGFGALTLARHGSAEQKAALLPKLATGEVETCFALTEPDAGSNSLAISTFARRDGDDFVVNGQKIWITGVQRASWMLLVTRTIPAAEARPRSDGLTVFLVNVPEAVAAGQLSYRPIPKMGANTTPSNMVFIDDLRLPASSVVGEVDRGGRAVGRAKPRADPPGGQRPRRGRGGAAGGRRLREAAGGLRPSPSGPTRPSRSRSPRSRPRSSWPG